MNLDHWSDWLTSKIGVNLSRGSAGVFRSYVERRSRALGLASPEAYQRILNDPDGSEFQRLVDALTVTHTWFFRDPQQIETFGILLEETARRTDRRPLKIWTAGCASGEEPYTIGLVARSLGIDAEILGTDINSSAIEDARRGEYGAWSCHAIPRRFVQHFMPIAGETGRAERRRVRIRADLAKSVSFEVHNLLAPPPSPQSGGQWDFILCRNVLIYFTAPSARECLAALSRSLAPLGYLLLGASDVLLESPPQLVPVTVNDRIVFQRCPPEGAARVAAATRPLVVPASKLPAAFEVSGFTSSLGPAKIEKRTPATSTVAAFATARSSAAPVVETCSPEPLESATSRAAQAIAKGHEFMSLGDLNGARIAYVRACEEDPVSAPAHFYAGMAHYFTGDLPTALHYLRGCLLLDAICWPASYYLAVCLEALGLAPEAQREFRHAARLCEASRNVPLETPESPLFGFHQDLAWLVCRRGRLA